MTDLEWNRQALLEEVGGSEELLSRLLDIFRQTSAEHIEKLIKGMEERDAEALIFEAHTLKGSAANLGIEKIRQLAAEIERAVRDNDLDRAAHHMPELLDLMGQLAQLK